MTSLEEGFAIGPWRFRAVTGAPIGTATQLEELAERLQLGNVPLPEMTHPDAFLEVQCLGTRSSSGESKEEGEAVVATLRFDTTGALAAWHAAQRANHQ